MVLEGRVSEDGGLDIPREQLLRWGLGPGTRFLIRETTEGLILQGLDPALTRVYVEPTNGCNLSCRTCVRHSWNEPTGVMPLASYRKLMEGLAQIPSLSQVSFWGFGEPLLHPDIVEMVALAKGLGVKTQMITNGLLLSPEKSAGLVAAGLDSLVVSVDGASPSVNADVRAGADLQSVQANLDALNALRKVTPDQHPEVGLEFVAMRRNISELPEIRRLAALMAASFIVVTNVLPYTAELKDELLYGQYAGTGYPRLRTNGNPEIFLPRMDLDPQVVQAVGGLLNRTSASGLPRERWEGAGGYCRFVGEGSMVVAWDGEVSPCVALAHSYSCYVMGRHKRIKRYTLGNINHDEIGNIWSRDEFVGFRDRVRRFDFSPCSDCGGCDLSETNQADCAGNGFPVCGDCLWAKGVIQCP